MRNFWLLSLFVLFVSAGVFLYMKRPMYIQLSKNKQLSGWTIVIPGITGDLAKRKLIPALYRLYKKGMQGIIIGTGRRDANITDILRESKKFVEAFDDHIWNQFSHMIVYHKLDPSKSSDFKTLADGINQQESARNLLGKRLIYLSLPADVFCQTTRLLVGNNIIAPHKSHYILYEKPFGWDLASAQEINKCITSLLPDKQIYRVDHYVAKGLTQSLAYLSGTNFLFDQAWHGKGIDSVSVLFHETLGIEERGAFYDRYGAIKDVMQNHMLQLLAFFALNISSAKTPGERAHQKALFLNSLSVQSVRRGQYEGYLAEKDVASHSKTETYAAVMLASSDPRWKGVQFILETGKALAKKKTELVVTFRPIQQYCQNQLIVQFAPKELLSLRLNGLMGKNFDLAAGSFEYPEAYEALLADVLTEKLDYSVSFEEVEAQWRVVDGIISTVSKVSVYPKGGMVK